MQIESTRWCELKLSYCAFVSNSEAFVSAVEEFSRRSLNIFYLVWKNLASFDIFEVRKPFRPIRTRDQNNSVNESMVFARISQTVLYNWVGK